MEIETSVDEEEKAGERRMNKRIDQIIESLRSPFTLAPLLSSDIYRAEDAANYIQCCTSESVRTRDADVWGAEGRKFSRKRETELNRAKSDTTRTSLPYGTNPSFPLKYVTGLQDHLRAPRPRVEDLGRSWRITTRCV